MYVSKWFKLIHKAMEIIHDVSVKIKRHAYTLWSTLYCQSWHVKFPRLCWKGQKVCAASRWPITPPKTNMDSQNDGLEHVSPSNMAIWGIYVRFQGGYIQLLRHKFDQISYSFLSIGWTTRCFAGSFLTIWWLNQPIRKIYVKLDRLLR